MKKTINSAIGVLTILTSASVGAQTANSAHQLRAGVLYNLTPKMAQSLNLDFARLQKDMHIQNNEKILFKITEDGELDLAIYENSIFSQARSDDELK